MQLGRGVVRMVLAFGAVLLLFAASPGCSRKSGRRAHPSAETPAPPVPTPDTTPIDVLRTPAGLVLKTEESTPPPGRETTPAPPPEGRATP
jgi:hypothetical protein